MRARICVWVGTANGDASDARREQAARNGLGRAARLWLRRTLQVASLCRRSLRLFAAPRDNLLSDKVIGRQNTLAVCYV